MLIPVGCTENHGMHLPSADDTLFVTMIAEAVRRYTAKKGAPVNIALPPLNYGGHPYHHVGMPGTCIVREDIVRGMMMDVMLGLWNDGFRKQIIINNHGHLWMLESAIQEFQKKYQLPGYFRVMDWHRAVREFFATTEQGGRARHSVRPRRRVRDLDEPSALPGYGRHGLRGRYSGRRFLASRPHGQLRRRIFGRPSRWSEAEGQSAIEIKATPEGVVGKSTHGTAQKAKRPLAAILSYVTLLCDDILKTWPAGTVPPTELVTLRDPKEMEAYLREPLSPGWKSVYQLPQIGQIQ